MKTRKDPGHDRPFDPKLYETPETPSRCPVRLLLELTYRRPVEMCQADSPFYILIHPSYKQQHTWYKCQSMGVHSLGGMMKKMASDGCLPGRKTNQSGRKTTVKRSREASVDNVDTMQLTGHKNAESLNHYSTVSSKKLKEMSDILTNLSSDHSLPVDLNCNHLRNLQSSNKPETVSAPLPDDIDFLFTDDFDVENVMQEIERYELNRPESEFVINNVNTTPTTMTNVAESCTKYKSVSTRKALGLANSLFASANISGGNFNIAINFGHKK